MASPFLAFPYFAFVALFYRQSDGFIQTCDNLYEYWKTLPVLILSILCVLVGAGLRGKQKWCMALGLFFCALGDYLIAQDDGIIKGAAAFAVGHIFYLMTFAHRARRISSKVVAASLGAYAIVGLFAILPLVFHYPKASSILILYSVILTACFVLSGSLYIHGGINEAPHQLNNLLRFAGFSLFYLSDSILVLQYTGFRIPIAEKLILFTYFAAQYFILWGTCLTQRISVK